MKQTANPTISPSNIPTQPSKQPTSAPTSAVSLCETNPYPTWCYYVDLYPGTALTITTVDIIDTDRNSQIYFNIVFAPRDELCDNPSITFEYEQIDVGLTTEYIEVPNNAGSLLSQCQGNGIFGAIVNVVYGGHVYLIII